MKPKVIKYFWTTVIILVILLLAAFLWAKADDSCSGGAFLCVPLSAWVLLGIFAGSPIVLLIVSVIAILKDTKDPNLPEQSRSVIKKGIKLSILIFCVSIIVRWVWYFNYHIDIWSTRIFFPSIIFIALGSLILSVFYVQWKLKQLRKQNNLDVNNHSNQ